MQQLIEYSYERMDGKNVYPFCSFIVKDGVIIGKGANYAVNDFGDKTKHGEMVAINNANRALKSRRKILFDEPGYVLYGTCEPCMACFDASLWTGIKEFVFAVDHHDFPEYFNDHPYNLEDYEKEFPGDIVVTRGVLKQEGIKLFNRAKRKYGW